MLRFAEEIILILLDDEDGKFVNVPRWSLNYALAGGVLMDLAMENRIDTDIENLMLIDSTPVGDSLLDPVLAEIAEGEGQDTRYWLERSPIGRAKSVRTCYPGWWPTASWSARTTDLCGCSGLGATPMIDGQAEREVKLRIMGVLFSDENPRPPGRDDHLPGGCVRHLQGAAVSAAVGAGRAAYRAGAEAGPHRPGDVTGDPGYRTDGDFIDAAASLLGRITEDKEERRSA